MNTHRGLAASVAAGLFIALSFSPLLAAASEMRAGDQPSITASETIKGNAYMAGGNVTGAGTVNGDLVVAGGNILINGPVSNDVLAAGGTITILGAVGDDVRVAGGNIVVSGGVKGDIAAAGGQTQISGSGVGGDVLWGGGTLRIDAPVAGSLKLGGGDVTINSTIHGNVEFHGGSLTLGKNAVIDGNLTYQSPKEATLQEGAVVKGETKYTPTKELDAAKAGLLGVISLALVGKWLAILACALVIGLIFRRFSSELVKTARMQPLMEIGRGGIVLIVLPVASIVFLMTLLGIPLGLLGLVSFAALMIFASITAPIVLGSFIAKWVFKTGDDVVSWKTILLGTIVYTLIGLVPFVGWIAKLAVFLLTVGAMVKIKWDVIKEWR